MTKTLKLLPCLFVACCGAVATAATQAASPSVPILQGGELAVYPLVAQLARITGKITVRVTVKGGRVADAVVVPGHQGLLETLTVQNVKTWRFARDVNGNYTVTYTYEISGEGVAEQPTNARVEILPSLDVRITAQPVLRMTRTP